MEEYCENAAQVKQILYAGQFQKRNQQDFTGLA